MTREKTVSRKQHERQLSQLTRQILKLEEEKLILSNKLDAQIARLHSENEKLSREVNILKRRLYQALR